MDTANPSHSVRAERCELNRAAAARLDRVMTSCRLTNEALSERCGISPTTLSRMRRGERWLHTRVLEALPLAARRAYAALVAEESGARVVPLGGPRKCRPVGYLAALGGVSSELGDVLTATTRAIADGRVDPDEAQVVVRECDEAIDQLLALRERAREAQTTGGETVLEVAQ